MVGTTVYGRQAVLEALRAGEAVTELHVAAGAEARGTLGEILALAGEAGVPVKRVPPAALDRLAGGTGRGRHQGVIAQLGDFVYRDLVEILACAIRRNEPPLVLALDEIQDVHNLGSLIRTAEATGTHGVLLATHGSVGVTAAVRKASAGAVAHLAVARTDLPTALDALRERGVRVVGLDAAGEVDYRVVDLTGPLAVVVGGEGRGVSRAVARRCDVLVRLPQRGRVASLNAAVAGSILLYEALRQRLSAPAGQDEGDV
jgi:23S rRNA (guanosine2251-2'-O)-methyltransferase